MEQAGKMQGEYQIVGMRLFLGKDKGFAAPCQGLLSIAEHPQRPGRPGEARNSRISPTTESQGTTLLGIIEGNSLL
jgi:hypothetical protein